VLFRLSFWRKCRIALRWTRYLVWCVLVLALLALAWVNVVGVPDFVKSRIVASLGERGVHLEFTRMRWRMIRGLVAENVIVGDRLARAENPRLTAGQIQLRLDYAALLKRKFQLTGVVVRDGIFTLPLSSTNRLAFTGVQSEVRFLPGDTWALDELRAEFSGGIRLRLAGEMAHAPEAAHWEIFAGKKPGGQSTTSGSLEEFSRTLAKIHFERPLQVSAQVTGDARDVHSFTVQLNADAPDVVTPWFSARGLQAAGKFSIPADALDSPDVALGFWTNALPFRLAWISRAAELEMTNLSLRALECGGEWRAPVLSVGKISARSASGQLDAAASLDVTTRELQFTNRSAFDLHLLQPFLPSPARAQVAEVLWTQPPRLDCEGRLTLPAWTNDAADWRELFGPTARLNGEFAATNAVLHGQTVELARTRFSYANHIWSVPDLQLQQGRTQLEFSGEQSVATENFRGTLRGAFDLATAKLFLPTNVNAIVSQIVTLNEQARFDVTAAGNWRDLATFTATGRVAVTNFSIREQTYESVAADVFYTNRVLSFLHPQSLRAGGTQTMTADAVVLDWNARMYFFTNGYSTTMPMAMIRCIGPKTAALIEPYEFLAPPTVRVNGQLPLRDINRGKDLEGTDMNFDIIRGAPFRWSRLRTTNITGTVRWMGQTLVLTNVAATLYGGDGTGWANFDFHPTNFGCNFSFGVAVTNVDVHLLGMDLADSKTNLIEGLLTGETVVTDGMSETWRSWNGRGHAELRDGTLWNIALFGFLSPALNSVSPGLGNNRATDASAHFRMTNGVAFSDDLEIHTLTMRLLYAGTVDLSGEVDARVTAQLMRNVPIIGSTMSTVLYPLAEIFKCQVNGKVSDPKVKPIYIPGGKYLFSPIRSLEEIFTPVEKPKG
jgi:hypothetical protein